MPIVDMPLDVLLRYVNAGATDQPTTADDLHRMLPRMGCAVEDIADVQQFGCTVCGKTYDRTPAQGPPLACSQCGADFRAAPQSLTDLGPTRVARLEMLAVRADIFDPGGMARYVRSYLGRAAGLRRYELAQPRITVQIDPHLSDETSRRPYIACAVLRNVKLDHALVKILMNLQEDLHWALGRDRKLASIGVYDLDKLRGTTFHYDAVAPDALRFVPLGFEPDRPESLLTPGQILEQHNTGKAYAHLLRGMTAYPLLRDEHGTVLSMPPIINSESTRVTMGSTALFCDVTGLSQRVVDRALNVLVTSMSELLPDLQIEAVTIDSPAGQRLTPDLAPTRMTLDVQHAARTIGIPLDASALQGLLERMGHGVSSGGKGQLAVDVPAYRNDVMHPVDLIEDAAVAYGYDHIPATLVPTFTIGVPQPIEEHSTVARRILTGLGFHQVMTLVLTSEPAAFEKLRQPADPRLVRIDNPISTEQTICRVSLLPGLLETLALNKQYELPQQLFEVGDICICDPQAETGAREERLVAAALIGTHVGYADARAVADAFVHELARSATVRPTEHPTFVAGRVAALHDPAGQPLGILGEIHPAVLESYGLRHAVAVVELSLQKLLGLPPRVGDGSLTL